MVEHFFFLLPEGPQQIKVGNTSGGINRIGNNIYPSPPSAQAGASAATTEGDQKVSTFWISQTVTHFSFLALAID
jgi:hypothetical protein